MKTSQVVLTSLSLLALGGLGYSIYFDYRRRTDPSFRKSLKKDSKRTSNISKKETERQKKAEDEAIQNLLDEIREPGGLPTGVEEKEQYFLQHVALGEQLFAQGQERHLDASIAFFRALKVYPAPVELIVIYQKAVPKEVFDCIMRIVSKDIATGGEEAAGIAGQNVENLDVVDEEGPSGAAEDVKEEQKETSNAAPAAAPQTDSGSSQEWDTLSATSLNETGVIVTPNPASSVSGETETESTSTAEAEATSAPAAFAAGNDWNPAPVFGEEPKSYDATN